MMATVDRVGTFLEAEEHATRLVEELTRLKTEAESYGSARSLLDQSGKEVGRLAGELAHVSAGIGQLIETVRAIGTPELLKQHEETKAELAVLRRSLVETRTAIEAGIAAQREECSSLLRATGNEVRGAMQAAAAEQTSAVAAAIKKTEIRLDHLGQSITTLRTLGRMSLGAVSVLFVVVLALAML